MLSHPISPAFYNSIPAALLKNKYEVCGMIIALSLIHGGPGPHLLAPVFYRAIVHGPEKAQVSIEDMPANENARGMNILNRMKKINQY